MKTIFGVNNIPKLKNIVVAMGVFDGVHKGHRTVLESAVDKARHIKGSSMVLTFWPHPQGEGSLYSLEHRLNLIAELGIDVCLVINFNRHFARMPAEEFINNILIKKIGARFVFIGENFRFGRNAQGDPGMLELFSKKYNFEVKAFRVIKTKDKPISSTLIRSLIKKGEIAEAGELLGRPVSILGTVIKGARLGRRLGFPTANIDPHHEIIPPEGIYASKVIYNRKKFNAACYIGTKPTFSGRKHQVSIEAHIFNFKKDIYGEYLEIQFIKMIRNDRKFDSPSALVIQMKKDLQTAKKISSLH
jgi:riboflavin kinase / FMN adenylyltransferase